MLEGTLNKIFRRVLEGEEVAHDFFTKAEYESARTSLLRKFRKSNEEFEKCGFDGPNSGKYFKCSWNRELQQGSFKLEADNRRSHTGKAKIYGKADV